MTTKLKLNIEHSIIIFFQMGNLVSSLLLSHLGFIAGLCDLI